MGRKSVTYLDYLCCQAEEWFARGRYLIKFRSYVITNVQGRWRNVLTLLEIFLGHFIWTPLLNSFAEDHGHFFSSSLFLLCVPIALLASKCLVWQSPISGIVIHFHQTIPPQLQPKDSTMCLFIPKRVKILQNFPLKIFNPGRIWSNLL